MLNKVILEGRFTASPELRQTPSGTSVCRFSVAWNGPKEKVEFFNCTAWSGTAEFVSRNFRKGDGITVVGHLSTSTYDARIPGSAKTYQKTSWEIVCESVDFPIGGRREPRNDPEAPPPFTQNADMSFEEIEADGDLPF